MKRLFKQYKSQILYIIFGVLTTAINYAAYLILYKTGILKNVPSTIIAWILATVFAFVTNKLFVFESMKMSPKTLFYELGSFYFFRIATGLLDLVIMWVAVDLLMLNAALFKLISNIFVIILNYAASRLVIFK